MSEVSINLADISTISKISSLAASLNVDVTILKDDCQNVDEDPVLEIKTIGATKAKVRKDELATALSVLQLFYSTNYVHLKNQK